MIFEILCKKTIFFKLFIKSSSLELNLSTDSLSEILKIIKSTQLSLLSKVLFDISNFLSESKRS